MERGRESPFVNFRDVMLTNGRELYRIRIGEQLWVSPGEWRDGDVG